MKGNRGEWSEIYVFLKLLAEGRLYAADENLELVEDSYYPVIKILRREASGGRDYTPGDEICVYESEARRLKYRIPVMLFVEKSNELYEKLRTVTGRSFSFPEIQRFLNSIDVETLGAPGTDKTDVTIVVHDQNTGSDPTLGFSIKSFLGGRSTLFNAGAGTNFIYRLKFPETGNDFDVRSFNEDTFSKTPRIMNRLLELERLGVEFEFEKVQSENLRHNLILIDSRLPDILSHLILNKYKRRVDNLLDLLEILKEENPLGFDTSSDHPFYEYKIKNFLVDIALGMTPEIVWTGTYNATGGIIIVKQSGEILCYHIYNRNEFEDYLLNNTRLEQPSTGEDRSHPGSPVPASRRPRPKPYKFGWVYEENGDLFIKLNLQIRFT